MTPELLTVLMLLSVLIGISLGYPTAFTLAGISMIFGFFFVGPGIFDIFIARIFGLMKSYIFLAAPLFLFMGVFMEKAGVAEKLYSSLYLILGGIRGGLGMATIIICTIFAAATGIVGASEVTIGLLALPSMLNRNYDKSLACGTISAGGALGVLIPPSVLIVLYGPTAGLSVGKLFAGAVIPGLLLSFLYLVYILVRCYFRPQDGPPMPKEERNVPVAVKLRLLLTSIVPPIILIFAVLGTIFFGIASVTEAAAMGVLASLILGASYRRLTFSVVMEATRRTIEITAMIMMICVGAGFFSAVFVAVGGGDVLTQFVGDLPFGKWGILFSMIGLLIVLGMFIDWIGIILIVVPLFTPIAAELGFHPIWFAMLVIITMQTSYLTPPFATAIFYLKGIAPPEIKTTDIYRGVIPFILIQILGVVLCVIFPRIITYLPDILIK